MEYFNILDIKLQLTFSIFAIYIYMHIYIFILYEAHFQTQILFQGKFIIKPPINTKTI